MTTAENKPTVGELVEKYGEVLMRFTSYYKYSFSYVGKMEDGTVVSASVGGNHDDIYRFSVSADGVEPLKKLDPLSVHVKLPDGSELSAYNW